jgi:hypothetical protein
LTPTVPRHICRYASAQSALVTVVARRAASGQSARVLEFEETVEPPPGYRLSGPDNNAEMYDRRGGTWDACASCGRILNRPQINPDFTLDVEDDELIDYGMGQIEQPAAHSDAKRIFDFSFTSDGWSIVSRTMREIVEREASTPIEFFVLAREPNFYVMRPTEVLEVDTERSGFEFEPLCPACGKPQGAYGGVSCLRDPSHLDPHGMYRSDVERGGVNSGHPAVFVGPELAHHLRPLNGVVLYHALNW